jgi:4-amino-4-deoxy-L-arabinose transferase-like glycosyltransferase
MPAMQSRQSIARFNRRIFIYLMVLVAFALRVYQLGAQSIWWDESLSLYRATRDLAAILSNKILIQNVITTDLQPPLYFILLHFLVGVAGTSEYALRFVSVIANVATVPLFYALARRWFSPGTAIVAACLGAVSPFWVYYAQESRPYALALFWSLLAIYALVRVFAKQTSADKKWLVVYILSTSASLYTNYYADFWLPFHAVLILVYVWRTRNWRAYAWAMLPALPAASFLFFLPMVLAGATENVKSGPTFVPVDVILLDLLHSFSTGVTVDASQVLWIDVALGILFAAGILFANSKFQIQNSSSPQSLPNHEPRITNYELRILLLAYFAVPVLFLLLASAIRPLYQNSRYLIALSPVFYLGVASGVAALGRWWKLLAIPVLAVFFIGAGLSLDHWYFDPSFGKDDHRAWAEFLRERVLPGDFLILNSPHTEELYRYYADDVVPIATLPILRADGIESPDQDRAVVREALQKNPRVWYLSMHTPFDDPQARIEKYLNEEGVLLDQASFHGTSTAISLSQFAREMPTLSASQIAHPLDRLFDDRLRLLGYDAPASLQAGTRIAVKLFWRLDEPAGEDYGVSLRLIDDGGARWGQWDSTPLGNRAGTSTWVARKIFVDAHALPIDARAPSGHYRLQVQVYHSATGNSIGDPIILGDLQIIP